MRRNCAVKEKETGNLLVSCVVMRYFVVVLLLVMPIYLASASLAAGGADFEIPISELSKTKKESPQKQAASEPKKKKKNAARHRAKKTSEKKDTVALPQEPLAETVAPAKPVDQVKSPGNVVPGEAAPQAVQITSASIKENVSISHIPNSFVVADKSTVIHAVIYTREVDPREVNCKVRVTEAGSQSLVKMVKVDGTRFTYAATLPGLPPKASSLRYTIVVTDSLGKDSTSPEFVTPVKVSPVVPSWQF